MRGWCCWQRSTRLTAWRRHSAGRGWLPGDPRPGPTALDAWLTRCLTAESDLLVGIPKGHSVAVRRQLRHRGLPGRRGGQREAVGQIRLVEQRTNERPGYC